MTFFDDLGLRAAEQLEGSLGPYVALASYKRLLGARRPTRTKAVLGVLRCAVALADSSELEQAIRIAGHEADELVESREVNNLDAFVGDACAIALDLAKRNGRAALELARDLRFRAPTAARAYLVARLEDDAGNRALDAWIDATRLAASELQGSGERTHASTLYLSSLSRWIEIALAAPERLSEPALRNELVARALEVSVDDAPPAQRLAIARARLLATSKFQRASGLSLLVDLARASNEAVRRSALLICARHADSAARLEPIEAERVAAALKNGLSESERDAALARLELRIAIDALEAPTIDAVERVLERVAATAPELSTQVRRVRGLLRDPSDGPASAPPSGDPADVSLASLALDALLALRANQPLIAARALDRAKDVSTNAVPAVLHAAIGRALATKDVGARRAAAALAIALFRRRAGAPRDGWSTLGLALARAGFHADASEVLAEAARLREPGAATWAGEVERRIAYLALAKGDRAAALENLRRAAEHLGGISRGAPANPRV